MNSRFARLRPVKSASTTVPEKTISKTNSSYDATYRNLLGSSAWQGLSPEIRRRFSVRPESGESLAYSGEMQTVELSSMGWLFAHVCRLIGTPLTLWRGTNIPVSVELTVDKERGGIAWLRTYDFGPGRQFTVRSTKSLDAAGVLTEHIGCGFSMRLSLSEQDGNLIFISTAYQFSIAGRTFNLPSLLTPGVTTVTHEQIEGEQFRFSLSVDHPLLGRTIYQSGEFYSSDVSDR